MQDLHLRIHLKIYAGKWNLQNYINMTQKSADYVHGITDSHI